MKAKEFYHLTRGFYEHCMDIMKSKGEAYSGQEDKLGNFKRTAERNGILPILVWKIFFDKHYDALCSYIRGEYKDSEPIKGRIADLINYLFLLRGLLREAEIEKGDVPIINEEGHSNEEVVPYKLIDAMGNEVTIKGKAGEIIEMTWDKKKKQWVDKDGNWVVGTGKK